MTTRQNCSLWLSDNDFNCVFLNKKFRDTVGVSYEDALSGFTFQQILPDEKFAPLYPTSGKIATTRRKIRFADGHKGYIVNMYRQLEMAGQSFGYIGITYPIDDIASDVPYPAPTPLRTIHNDRPILGIDIAGVLADHVTAYSKYYPMFSGERAEDYRDIGAFQQQLFDICSGDTGRVYRSLFADNPHDPSNPLDPYPEFVPSDLKPFADINFEGLEEALALDLCRVVFPTKACQPNFHLKLNRLTDWFRSHGLTGGEIDDRDMDALSKLQSRGCDAHLEDDPEDWIACLFAGIPCYLYTRPWNRSINTPFRVDSLDEYLLKCGVAHSSEVDDVLSQLEMQYS